MTFTQAAGVLLSCSFLLAAALAPAQDKIRLDDLGNFVDSHGRVRIFRGVNSVKKTPPWYSQQLLNRTLLAMYEDWGFNVVRVGAMWAGVQPSAAADNSSYLAVLASVVDSLGQFGMYSILDMHQDVLSSKFGSYDGAPRWLIDSLPPSRHPYPWPLTEVTSWSEGYLTEAVGNAFQHLYRNSSAALSRWTDFWLSVAKTVSAKPSLIGYELINEPWPGDVYSDPALLLPGHAGRVNLLPVYDLLSERLGQADPDSIVFYEPVTWSLVVGGSGVGGTGFDRVPAGRRHHSALSFHYYCWILGSSSSYEPEWQRLACDLLLLRRTLANAAEARRRTGGGLVLTEFGLCAPNGMANSTGTVECDTVLQEADSHMLSWTYWDSKFMKPDGSADWSVIRSFARAYPTATAGQPISFSFDLATASFQFAFRYNASVRADTEVFLPMSVHYPHGVAVAVSKNFSFVVKGNRLSVSAMASARSGQIVTVAATRK